MKFRVILTAVALLMVQGILYPVGEMVRLCPPISVRAYDQTTVDADPIYGVDYVKFVAMLEILERNVAESGGQIESFRVRQLSGGPALVAVVRKPEGHIYMIVDHTAVVERRSYEEI